MQEIAGPQTLTSEDKDNAVALWIACGLTVPWNDPSMDFDRSLATPTSTLLGLKRKGELIGTLMAGYDGHRGWLYYLAVGEAHRRQGLGRVLVEAGERWLQAVDAPKIQLMVRRSNHKVIGFYEALGYEESDVVVLGKRFAR